MASATCLTTSAWRSLPRVQGMADRLDAIGSALQVVSHKGEGTTIEAGSRRLGAHATEHLDLLHVTTSVPLGPDAPW